MIVSWFTLPNIEMDEEHETLNRLLGLELEPTILMKAWCDNITPRLRPSQQFLLWDFSVLTWLRLWLDWGSSLCQICQCFTCHSFLMCLVVGTIFHAPFIILLLCTWVTIQRHQSCLLQCHLPFLPVRLEKQLDFCVDKSCDYAVIIRFLHIIVLW